MTPPVAWANSSRSAGFDTALSPQAIEPDCVSGLPGSVKVEPSVTGTPSSAKPAPPLITRPAVSVTVGVTTAGGTFVTVTEVVSDPVRPSVGCCTRTPIGTTLGPSRLAAGNAGEAP